MTDLQAVKHNGLKILQAVFYRAGTVNGGAGWNTKVDAPCILMVREVKDGVEVTAANPENKPLSVNIELDRKLTGQGVSTQGSSSKIHFDLPGGMLAGSSIIHVFKRG